MADYWILWLSDIDPFLGVNTLQKSVSERVGNWSLNREVSPQ